MHDPGTPAPAAARCDAPDPALLLALLREDALDAALDAGLMALDVATVGDLDPDARALLVETQQRLRAAWAARERYRARATRLARRAAEREARRAAGAAPASPSGPAPAPGASPSSAPLPAAAAAALARAKARAQRP